MSRRHRPSGQQAGHERRRRQAEATKSSVIVRRRRRLFVAGCSFPVDTRATLDERPQTLERRPVGRLVGRSAAGARFRRPRLQLARAAAAAAFIANGVIGRVTLCKSLSKAALAGRPVWSAARLAANGARRVRAAIRSID